MSIRSNKDLGESIRRARQQLGYRQIELAQKASVRQALISDLENGATSARLDTILKVLAALDLDLSVVPRKKDNFDPMDY